MSRESRLIAILAAIGAAGVIGLTLVANEYKKALESVQTVEASARATRMVDGYLAAREAAKAVLLRYPVFGDGLPAEAADAYRAERSGAIAAHGMTYEEYAIVRGGWGTYRGGGRLADRALESAFDAKRTALYEASRGAVDAVDEAIK